MCTVSFIAAGDRVFITHSRDESSSRLKALPPKAYAVGNNMLVFPKDNNAGGTWVAMNDNGNAAALLNGAFIKHQHKPPYKQSRGLVLLDIVSCTDMFSAYASADLDEVEPFTVVLWNNSVLMECRWDGNEKYLRRLDGNSNYLWSSATLYEHPVVAKRRSWFAEWQLRNPYPSQEDIICFHLSGGDGDAHNDLRMNREGRMLTVSITGIEITQEQGAMTYLDLSDGTRSHYSLPIVKYPAVAR